MAQVFVKQIYLMKQLRILRGQLNNFHEELQVIWDKFICPQGSNTVPCQDLIYRLQNLSHDLNVRGPNGSTHILK